MTLIRSKNHKVRSNEVKLESNAAVITNVTCCCYIYLITCVFFFIRIFHLLLVVAFTHHIPETAMVEANGHHNDFDPSAPPPFKIAEIRAAIPKHCWVKNPWRSLSYVLRDVIVVIALIVAAIHFDSWFFWPLYWILQGTMFWALFVLGHDW